MIIRPDYMTELSKYTDTPLVKIVSGVRRCGKSEFKKTTAKYPKLIDLLYELFEDDKLSTATAEACDHNKSSIMKIIKKSDTIRLYATLEY